MGVRALVMRGDEVLLVRMTYVKGWALPGGGVDRGESAQAAAIREVYEECGLKAEQVSLFGLYYNTQADRHDHISVYLVDKFSGEPQIIDTREIAEVRFFKVHNLPQELRGGHRRRIEEYARHVPRSELW